MREGYSVSVVVVCLLLFGVLVFVCFSKNLQWIIFARFEFKNLINKFQNWGTTTTGSTLIPPVHGIWPISLSSKHGLDDVRQEFMAVQQISHPKNERQNSKER